MPYPTPVAETQYLNAVVTAHGEVLLDSLATSKSEAISNAVGFRTQTQGGTPDEHANRQAQWLRFKANGDTVRRVVLVDTDLWFGYRGVVSWATELVHKLTGKHDPSWSGPESGAELVELRESIRLLSEKATHPVPFAFDDQVRWILGQPNFMAGGFARTLRKAGHAIPTKAEEEQAFVAYWMLGLYLEHGATWREVANAELVAIDTAHRTAEQSAARAAAGPDA